MANCAAHHTARRTARWILLNFTFSTVYSYCAMDATRLLSQSCRPSHVWNSLQNDVVSALLVYPFKLNLLQFELFV